MNFSKNFLFKKNIMNKKIINYIFLILLSPNFLISSNWNNGFDVFSLDSEPSISSASLNGSNSTLSLIFTDPVTAIEDSSINIEDFELTLDNLCGNSSSSPILTVTSLNIVSETEYIFNISIEGNLCGQESILITVLPNSISNLSNTFTVENSINVSIQNFVNSSTSIDNGNLNQSIFISYPQAYITKRQQGFQIFNIANSSPSLGFMADNGGKYFDGVENENIIFLTKDWAGIEAFNALNLNEFETYNTNGLSFKLLIKEGIMYLTEKNAGLKVFDISSYAVSDMNLQTKQIASLNGFGARVEYVTSINNTLFLSLSNSQISSVDITNPSDPVILNIFSLGLNAIKNIQSFDDKLYVTSDNKLSIFQYSGNDLILLSVVDSYSDGTSFGVVKALKVYSNYALLSTEASVFSVVDISNPDSPVVISSQNLSADIVDIDVYGGSAYVLTEANLEIISLATLDPYFTSISLSNNNKITLDFSEDVYSNVNGTEDLDIDDFDIILTDPENLSSFDNTVDISLNKISQSKYEIHFSIIGEVSGNEVITINPTNTNESNSTSVYSLSGVAANFVQESNNSVNLFGSAIISSTTISDNNNSLTIIFNEDVYGSTSLDDLNIEDFTIEIYNSTNLEVAPNPNSIIKTSQSEWVLSINITGVPTGSETIRVSPAENSIFNLMGIATSTSQSNNEVNTISVSSSAKYIVSKIAVDNSFVEITSDANIFSDSQQSELTTDDFILSIEGGTSTLTQDSPVNIENGPNSNSLRLFIGINGVPDGNERLTVNPREIGSIVDLSGNPLITDMMTIAVRLFPYTISANSLEINQQATSNTVIAGEVVLSNNTIGRIDDTDLITFTDQGEVAVQGEISINSDIRLKTNIVSLGSTLVSLMKLDGKRYNMISDNNDDFQIGLLAQEVQKVFPELVIEDSQGILSVNYQALIPVLVNALKEIDANYNELEKELAKLENLID